MGSGYTKIASNRRAFHDYEVLDRYEAGVELKGTEVKSLRQGHVSMVGSYAQLEGGQIYLQGLTIQPYEFGNRFNHAADRPRRLLLHKREILKLKSFVEQKGHSLVPLSIYFKNRKVKVEIGVCRGKKLYDKRETLKRKTADREAARAMSAAKYR
jgi:SsrA-binding protein